jgi:hypothetical protein
MSISAPNPPTEPTNASPAGAVMRPLYMGRDMKFFPVTESELDSFGSMNLEANVFLAVGTSLISASVGIGANHGFAEKSTPAGEVLFYFGCPVLILLGLVALWLCRKLVIKRDAIWNKIVSAPAGEINRPPSALS